MMKTLLKIMFLLLVLFTTSYLSVKITQRIIWEKHWKGIKSFVDKKGVMHFNAIGYGAIPGDTIDDGFAIQQMMNDVSNIVYEGEKVIYFPSGTYLIKDTLNILQP